MTDGLTGIGIASAPGAMKAIMVLDEAVAADLTMIGSTVVGRAVTTPALNLITRYLPSNNSIRNPLRLHP
jgi:hypothetical protein